MRTLFFRNRHLLFLAIGVIAVAGFSAIKELPRQEDPRIVNRTPFIITRFPGASAQRVETLVTEKIENKLEEIEQIDKYRSTSGTGISLISIELKPKVGADENSEIFSEIRDKLGEASRTFPSGVAEPIFDDKRDPVAYTLLVGITWTHAKAARLGIMTRLAKSLAEELRGVRGTELVRVYGAPREQITATVDPRQLADLKLTPRLISERMAASDAKAPAGTLRASDARYLIEVEGELDSIKRISSIPLVDGPNETVLKLGDVAELQREWQDPPPAIAKSDGRRTVFVAARMGSGQQIDRWTQDARRVVKAKREQVGTGIEIETVFEQNEYTSARLTELASNLVMGIAVVMVVILFTMGWRASFVVGSAIPLVAAAVAFGVYLVGGALHQMAIFGMIIALGLLIDNAIVVVDEVRKLRSEGVSRREAVQRTVSHLYAPLLASTLTTILAFAPMPLLPGGAGDFVGMIGGSVILAVASSYIFSMTIIVSLAALLGRFVKPSEESRWWETGLRFPNLAKRFRGLLRWTVRHPGISIPIACFPAILGLLLYPTLGRRFFPPVDRNMFQVQLWLPREASVEQTNKVTERVEGLIRESQEITRVDWMVGRSFPAVYYNLVMNQDNSPHYAQAILTCQSASQVDRLVERLQRQLDEQFPAAQMLVREFGQGPPVQAGVQYRIFGPEVETLQELGEEVRRHLQAHPQTLHTMVKLPRGQPKLWLDTNENEVQIAGFRLLDLADQLQTSLDGRSGGSVIEQLEEIPVRIRYDNQRRSDLELVASTNFVRPGDGFTPLETLGNFELRPALAGVYHFQGERCNVVEGYVRHDALPIDVTFDVREALNEAGFQLPPGYRMELGGTLEADREATGNLAMYAPVLIVLVISTMILSLRSVRMALLLILEGFACVGLALLSTWAYDLPFSFNTILGTLGLIGIGINDSIVVLAAIKANPEARAGDLDEIVREVFGCTRHIVSTSLTTTGSFLPLLLFIGGDFWPSLAIVLAGGVIGATLLSLILIPPGYVVLLRLQGALQRGWQQRPWANVHAT